MKKVLSILLTLLLTFNLALPVMAAEGDSNQITMSVDKSSVAVGDMVYVTVGSDTTYENVPGMGMLLCYDPDVFELVKDSCTIAPENAFFEFGNPQTNYGYTYVTVSFLALRNPTTVAAGNYVTAAFKAISTSSGAEFSIEDIELFDDNYDPVAYEVKKPNPVSVIVTEAPSYTGYAVSASEDKTVVAGENAEVKVKVSNSEDSVTTYNAYDLTLTYDADKLDYVSGVAADTDAKVTEENGSIRVIGYGEDKSLDTAAVTLTFKAKTAGDAEVRISSAKVDIYNQAISEDAPEAAVLDDTTVIKITGYTVNLGEGLSGNSTVEHGADYTFTATDADHYDYEITATMGGVPVTPTDNGDGTYTISNVTGNLEISAVMTPKSYSVTVTGAGKDDVTAADTATYNTPYTFTVNEKSAYTYGVSVTIGGNAYSLGTPEDGAYTIPGTDITGDIVITVSKTLKPSMTVSVTKPDYVTGEDTATKGEDYTFSIDKEEGYDYGKPTVLVDGVDITDELIENADGSYTIPGQYVTGDITIEVTKTAAITVDVVEYISLDEQSVYLITASGTFADGDVAKYDGQSMFWSDGYNAYAYLVISAESLDAVKTAAAEKVTMGAGAAAGTVVYTGDVNGTTVIDVNDAQLTYDMYNAKYDSFATVSMLKFLNADVNMDKTVNAQDAAAIVAAIK